MPIPSAGWILNHIPIVSFFAVDDSANSFRLVCAAGDTLFGYPLEDRNTGGPLRDENLGPESRKVMARHREIMWMGRAPVISRLEIEDRIRGPVQCLVAAHCLYDRDRRLGVSGIVVDVSGIPDLQGPLGVLSRGRVGPDWNQRTRLPETPDCEWLVEVLPVAFVVSENDPDYTIRHLSGSMERVVGYSSNDILSGRPKSWTLIDPTQVDLADEKLDQAIAAGQSVILRVPLAHESGAIVPILAIVAPYAPPGQPNGFFVSAVLAIDGAEALQGETKTFVMPR